MSIITLEDYNNDKDCPELVDAYELTYTDSLCQPPNQRKIVSVFLDEETRCSAAA